METVAHEIALREQPRELSVEQIVAQADKVQELIRQRAMREGHHYGTVPGTDKPTLLKPGAEKICMMFRVVPRFRITEKQLPGDHREYQMICKLVHIVTGAILGEGVGSASTMESKYRYRHAKRNCPRCGSDAIIKGREEYGGGWLCYAKRGGCGATFRDDDPEIAGQRLGRIENPDIADTYNTVLKVAKKRSHVDATLTAFAVSDLFAQDLEELQDLETEGSGNSEKPPKTEKPGKTASPQDQILRDELAEWSQSDLLSPQEAALIEKQLQANLTPAALKTKHSEWRKKIEGRRKEAAKVEGKGKDESDPTTTRPEEKPPSSSEDAEDYDPKADGQKEIPVF